MALSHGPNNYQVGIIRNHKHIFLDGSYSLTSSIAPLPQSFLYGSVEADGSFLKTV